jgi:hypothetical protein
MKKSLGFYHFCSLFILVFILFNFSRCSKSGGSGESRNIIDKNYFFTVNISGRSHTTYGWYQNDYPDVFNGAPFAYRSWTLDPLTGDTVWAIAINVSDEVTNSSSPKNVGDCNAQLRVTRKGDFLGIYRLVAGPRADNKFYDTNGKSYFIEQGGDEFIFARISESVVSVLNVEGTFQCSLIEVNGSPSVSIPASGSFRLKVF